MSPRKKMTDEERHEWLMRTDPVYRRLGELIESKRSEEERRRLPLGSEACSRETMRVLEERIAGYRPSS